MKSWPATRTEPEVARSRPATTISSEVLPEPLGPTTATDSPGAMSTSTRYRISTGPARLVSVSETSRKSMTGLATIAQAPARGLASGFASFYVNSDDPGVTERGTTADAESATEGRRSQTWCFAFSSAIGCIAALAFRRDARPRRASRCASSCSATAWSPGSAQAVGGVSGTAGARPEGERATPWR